MECRHCQSAVPDDSQLCNHWGIEYIHVAEDVSTSWRQLNSQRKAPHE